VVGVLVRAEREQPQGPINIFATHGVEHLGDPAMAARARGFESLLARVSVNRISLDHLNPQVQEILIP
jgi:hypothetical protein